MGAEGDITIVTTGMLPALLIAAGILTAPTALFLLWLYRRAVIRSMAGATPAAAPVAVVASSQACGFSQPLGIRPIDCRREPDETPLYRRTRRSLTKLGAIHAAAGLAYAFVFSCAWMILSGGDGFVWSRLLWLVVCYAWPTVIALGIVSALSRGRRMALAGGYFALLLLVAAYAAVRNPELSLGQLGFFWIFANAAPSVLFLAFLHRRVRAVGPLVLGFMIAAVTGSQLLLSLVGASDDRMRMAVDVGAAWGLGGSAMFVVILVAGFCLFGLLGWHILKRLGSRYRRRKTSDQALMLDALWLVFGIVQSITLSFEGWAWVFTGLAAFASCKLVALQGYRWLRQEPDRGITLLLLRVFSLGRRSERLFDALSKAWLRVGSITMIAGPDLVASTVEPHEFLEFVGGGLSHRFVRDDADLERRMRAMARGPDPDGRYRVNEFLCYADTWQQTMKRLASGADAVLMDLRSFAPDNQGCLYEIEQLVAGVDLRRVLLIVDETTDRVFLEGALHAAWERVATQWSAARHAVPQVRVLHLDGEEGKGLRVLLKLLLADHPEPIDAAAGSVVPT
jgi:hypothetical protein